MPIDILMPALSPTMEKGTLSKWLKSEGDAIKSGDILAEIETDKATMEVEAIDEGVLAKIMVPAGSEDVPVNQVIGLIAEEGEDLAAAGQANHKAEASGSPAKAEAGTPPGASNADAQILQYERPGATAGAPVSSGTASAFNREEHKPSSGPSAASGRVIASPLAKRLAKQAGLDLSAITGTGPHGRIVERDILSAKAAGTSTSKPSPSADRDAAGPAPDRTTGPATSGKTPDVRNAAAPTASDETIKKMFEAGSFTEVPHDAMRRTIARRLTEAKTTIPHFYLSADCDLDALLALREQINASAPRDKDGKPLFKVSVNDFVIKALALALQRVPDANATWTEGGMLLHKQSDVGVAVAIPGGLITPVVRRAETKTLSAISNEMKDYAARAKARKLKPDEYTGGTSAVSNLGMFGIKHFAAVINPPHATILAVGAGEKRVVVKDGAPAVATVMTVTLSTDHRAVDGALGAQLLDAFKSFVEKPMSMLV